MEFLVWFKVSEYGISCWFGFLVDFWNLFFEVFGLWMGKIVCDGFAMGFLKMIFAMGKSMEIFLWDFCLWYFSMGFFYGDFWKSMGFFNGIFENDICNGICNGKNCMMIFENQWRVFSMCVCFQWLWFLGWMGKNC